MPGSTGDEFCALPQCLHHKDDHDRDGCRTCPGDDERSWRHKYVPQPGATGDTLCVCGHKNSSHSRNLDGDMMCLTCHGAGNHDAHHRFSPRYAGPVEVPAGTTGVVTVAGRLVNPAASDPNYQPTAEALAQVAAFLDGAHTPPDAFDMTGTGIRVLRDQEAGRYRQALGRMADVAKSVVDHTGERPPVAEIERLAHAVADLLRASAGYDVAVQLHTIHTRKDS